MVQSNFLKKPLFGGLLTASVPLAVIRCSQPPEKAIDLFFHDRAHE